MPPRAPYIDFEENNRWSRQALQACLFHDHMMDAFRVKLGLNLDDGSRAAPRPIGDGIKKLAETFKGRESEFPLEKFINRW